MSHGFPSESKGKPWSLIVAAGLQCGIVAWSYRIELMLALPLCQFRAVTGWLCPDCGARRSVVALGRGGLQALRLNLLIYALAFLLVVLLFRLVRNEWCKGATATVDISVKSAWIAAYGAVLFWVLRNVV